MSSARELYGYALSLTRNHDDAEDLLQDTIIKAVLALDPTDSSLPIRAWLRRVMRNSFIDSQRRRSVEDGYIKIETLSASSEIDFLHFERASPEDRYLTMELELCVRSAVRKLSPEHYHVVDLHYTHGLSVHEISSNTGIPAGTVQSRLARARTQLRAHLDPLFLEGE